LKIQIDFLKSFCITSSKEHHPMLFFIDESGHDHGDSPYEVLAAVAIAEDDLWNLIQAIRAAEIEFFGVHLSGVGVEFKGKKLLKNKTFRHARQGPLIEPDKRRDLVRCFLEKGRQESQGGQSQGRTKDEFTAYGQAVRAFVLRILDICSAHRVKTFGALVSTRSPHSATSNFLRRDYSFLFERFYYYLEDCGSSEMGLVVFDELEKAQSRILIQQMERYFLETEKGYQRSSRIVPEPFFVHSDLTTAVQLADIVAYCFNWGTRLNKMNEPTRPEIELYAERAFNMRYIGERFDDNGQKRSLYGVFYIDDLRPKQQRDADK
jgi:hypothetical protein